MDEKATKEMEKSNVRQLTDYENGKNEKGVLSLKLIGFCAISKAKLKRKLLNRFLALFWKVDNLRSSN